MSKRQNKQLLKRRVRRALKASDIMMMSGRKLYTYGYGRGVTRRTVRAVA